MGFRLAGAERSDLARKLCDGHDLRIILSESGGRHLRVLRLHRILNQREPAVILMRRIPAAPS